MELNAEEKELIIVALADLANDGESEKTVVDQALRLAKRLQVEWNVAKYV